ncbi:MAG: ABC transporter ATP-binding protein [Thermomicrobiales bacterium]|nr:ABC transporter ATP-binding protein [Thermomicrobiales bacterium]
MVKAQPSVADTAASRDVSRASFQPAALETQHLHKRFGRVVAVDDLTIRVAAGEVFGFLGPNGAGKTTSIKMLMGLTRPTSGTARLLDRPLGDREARKRIGFLPEMFHFHEWLTGAELLDMHARLYGMSATERRARIPEVLEQVGMFSRRDQRLDSYSKGMKQRIGLAQALLPDPLVVFLDEPTSALDPIGRIDVRRIIQTLRDDGRTVFLNSHLLSEVESVCDRVAIINRGRVAATGPMRDLLGRELVVNLRLGRYDDDVQRAVMSFATMHGVERVRDASVVAVEVGDEETIARLVDALVALGVPVYGVTPHQQTLEDLFIQVVDASDERDPS